MNYLRFYILISLLGVQLLYSVSCIAQTSLGDKSIQEIKDPMFYIEGQLCQHVRKIFQDSKGNLWLGTNVYGLMRYDGDSLIYFTKKDGLGAGRITGIVEDKEGALWFGTYGGLTKYDGVSFTNFTTKDGLIDNDIWSLAIDTSGYIWIGTMNGVSKFDGTTFETLDIPKAPVDELTPILFEHRITCITQDHKGNIWFGTDGHGISMYNGTTFTYFTKENGLCDNNIYDLMTDADGNVWVGTMFGGVSKYDGKTFTNYTLNGVITGEEAGGFYQADDGNIWFAAENHGVYCYNGTSFKNLYTKEGLNTNGILSIYKDRQERFWFGGWGGLFRYDGTTFSSVKKGGPWSK